MAETTPPSGSAHKTYPMLGIVGVLLGALIATFLGRLLSVGIADLRGALHFDYDDATWITTSYNMGLMFIGPFSVFLGGLLGPKRVLLVCAAVFTCISIFLPLATGFPLLVALMAMAGLTAGTFYPLTMSFILRSLPKQYVLYGIAAYAVDAVFTTHVAHSYEAWTMIHLSWRWIFWTSVVLTIPMMLLVHFGMAQQPLPQRKPGQSQPSWTSFLLGSAGAALLYGALDQGEHLDWWRSGTFVAMVTAGGFLLVASAASHFLRPNPLVTLPFLRRRSTMFLAIGLFFFRFVLLSAVIVVPNYLATVQGFTAEQIGPVLLWLAVPQFLAGLLAVYLLERVDARVILAFGVALCGFGALMNANLTSAWSGSNFQITQLILAIGEGLMLNGLIGAIILDLVNSGSLEKGPELLTFAGFFQTVRLMGGEIGTSFMLFFLPRREQFHSNLLGLQVQAGSVATSARFHALTMGMQAQATTPDTAFARAAELLALTVRKQAFTLAIADCFLLIAVACVVCLVVVAFIGPLNIQYKHVLAAIRAQRTT
jgi:MFS transporter, DHA2 family, multidrug resistance protein